MRGAREKCALLGVALAFSFGCSDTGEKSGEAEAPAKPGAVGAAPKADDSERAEAEVSAERARQFPLHGLVTGVQLTVRETPDPEGRALGWVRNGSRILLKKTPTKTATCASGFYPIHPRGFVCAGEGVEIGDKAPESEIAVEPPAVDAALPYAYYFVKEPMVPEYHRLPSRDEQRAAKAFSERYLELLEANERKAELFRAGELGGHEPKKPAVVSRYLERGFYVAGTGVEVRAFRRFVRTVRGSYVKEARVENRTGADYAGVNLGEAHSLPLALALRTARPMKKIDRKDGTHKFIDDEGAEPLERQSLVTSWQGRKRIGDSIYHVLEGERYLRSWFVGVAEKVKPPFKLVVKDEPWVHVDLSEQTLVIYRGEEPVYVSLVSTGLDEHNTPTGTFTIQKKLISDTMADLGPDAGDDRYRIEDVPWTQYFEGSVALHGAFWHNRFGLQRSHGCVNLAPEVAHRVFNETWPEVPAGWHGVSTDGTGFSASRVVVTD